MLLSLNCFLIRFDGQLILPYMTPEQLGMEDEDIIDVFITKPSNTTKRGREEGAEENKNKRGADEMME